MLARAAVLTQVTPGKSASRLIHRVTGWIQLLVGCWIEGVSSFLGGGLVMWAFPTNGSHCCCKLTLEVTFHNFCQRIEAGLWVLPRDSGRRSQKGMSSRRWGGHWEPPVWWLLEGGKEIIEATIAITQVSGEQDADWKQGQFHETHRSWSLIRCEESPGLAAGFVFVP